MSEEATRLLKDNRRLKDKDAQLFAELKTMQVCEKRLFDGLGFMMVAISDE